MKRGRFVLTRDNPDVFAQFVLKVERAINDLLPVRAGFGEGSIVVIDEFTSSDEVEAMLLTHAVYGHVVDAIHRSPTPSELTGIGGLQVCCLNKMQLNTMQKNVKKELTLSSPA